MSVIVEAEATFTREANTVTYSSGDLVANSVTPSLVVPLKFDLGSYIYNECFIRRARITSSSLTLASYKVHLFTKVPVVINGDNVAILTPKEGYIGSMVGEVDKAFSDGSFGIAIPTAGSEINVRTKGHYIYGLLEALATRTPASSEIIDVTLELHRY